MLEIGREGTPARPESRQQRGGSRPPLLPDWRKLFTQVHSTFRCTPTWNFHLRRQVTGHLRLLYIGAASDSNSGSRPLEDESDPRPSIILLGSWAIDYIGTPSTYHSYYGLLKCDQLVNALLLEALSHHHVSTKQCIAAYNHKFKLWNFSNRNKRKNNINYPGNSVDFRTPKNKNNHENKICYEKQV